MGYYNPLRTESQKLANEILVSKPDLLLLLPHAMYLPNPVDFEHFSKNNSKQHNVNDNALTIKTASGDIHKTLLYCKENNINIKIDVLNRTKNLFYIKKYLTF